MERKDMNRIIAWAQQPTTIAGVAAFAGTISALLLHQMSWQQAVPVLVGAATSMMLPENTAAPGAARTLAQDALVLLSMTPDRKAGDAPAAVQQKTR